MQVPPLTVDLSLSRPPWEVSARSSFLRVSEGVALYLFVFFKEPVYFLHFKKNQNVPEFQIPHAKMSPADSSITRGLFAD